MSIEQSMETVETAIHIKADTQGLDATIEKAAKLKELLKEAKSLADDLASHPIEINLEIHV